MTQQQLEGLKANDVVRHSKSGKVYRVLRDALIANTPDEIEARKAAGLPYCIGTHVVVVGLRNGQNYGASRNINAKSYEKA